MLRTTRMVTLAAVVLTPLVTSAPAGRRPLPALQATSAYTYQGTVHAVNARAGSLDLITGVGMALRLVHMTTSPTTLLAGSGAGIKLAGLKPGDLVRADCRRTDAGLVANRIEKLEAPRP
ncbi:MAG: hypothetical protein AUI33_15375 [Ignavibacteria bacterium 13_1_40CM_2_61_4]|nr:MAG: hypothetical protein AUI33_15375 [Ignavibacteria bacterium 13_1_40CM_2_61_4]